MINNVILNEVKRSKKSTDKILHYTSFRSERQTQNNQINEYFRQNHRKKKTGNKRFKI